MQTELIGLTLTTHFTPWCYESVLRTSPASPFIHDLELAAFGCGRFRRLVALAKQ